MGKNYGENLIRQIRERFTKKEAVEDSEEEAIMKTSPNKYGSGLYAGSQTKAQLLAELKALQQANRMAVNPSAISNAQHLQNQQLAGSLLQTQSGGGTGRVTVSSNQQFQYMTTGSQVQYYQTTGTLQKLEHNDQGVCQDSYDQGYQDGLKAKKGKK